MSPRVERWRQAQAMPHNAIVPKNTEYSHYRPLFVMFVFAGAEELQVQANRFEVSTVKLRRKMWWKNLKVI